MAPKWTLYHTQNARSLRVLWTLKELGLEEGKDYALYTMPFPPRMLHKDYLRVNPLGTVPFFTDETSGAKMTESCAIPVYVAQHAAATPTWAGSPRRGTANGHLSRLPEGMPDLLVEPDHPEYGSYLNWLSHADATLTFPQTVALRYGQFETHKGLEQAAKDYTAWYLARLRWLEQQLEGREFLVANRLTVADICIAYALILGKTLGIDGKYPPRTAAYLARMLERPALQAAYDEEERSGDQFAGLPGAKL